MPDDNPLASEFDRATRLRDEGKLDEAIAVLNDLVAKLAPGERRLRAHSFMQLGYIYGRQGRDLAREAAFRAAVEIAPRMELASMGHFHALLAVNRRTEAYQELVRFVGLRDSELYRELLCDGFERDLTGELLELVTLAREHLSRHRRN